ncbi:zinc ABC transporter substrate-binding protein AztC [Halomonas sp. C22]|uniref:zinc ABC transporter substrate-binding protein AztC n=1 Tax=Halomonas sp. C22 TaxID=2580567 RepID=UPI0011A7CCAB|nr:zinc ABC transporter substrate-binding protein AztC [Halomonas sp. C22]
MGLLKRVPSLLAAGMLALGSLNAMADEPALNVVASFSIIEDLARQVGGERIALTSIVGANDDAHVYEPTPADVRQVAQADVVLINGLMFEGFLTRLIEASGTEASVVTVSEHAVHLEDPMGGHYHFYGDRAVFHEAPYDPHAWQSVPNARAYVVRIADAFCEADPEGCDAYRTNQQRYEQDLEALDQEIHERIARIPESRRTVVVAHHAFRYFEEAYGVRFLAPQGVSTESEATAAHVAKLIDAIEQQSAVAVFAENISNPRLVEQIAQEAGLSLSGTLYSDALSREDGPAASYLDMMRHNVDTLVTALQ